MATTTPSSTLAHDHERIRSPLARLRKFIAGYVSLEGATLVALFLALWFWIGLTLDYGSFRLFLVDWVQWLPWWFRATVLGTIVTALLVLLVLVVLVRLLVHFTDAALALLLERRFPNKLGDRLITAVELADPQQAAAIGYSAVLVRETIREAAARVDEVPVKEVFHWRRLVLRGVLFFALTVVLYLLVGVGFCAVRVVRGEGSAMVGFSELGDVSRIWFERNILLRNTIWPRRAHLEVVGFPDDLRIPSGGQPPTLRVRAWKYVLADTKAPEGWRLLRWADLMQEGRPAGLPAVLATPTEWVPREPYGITVDEVDYTLGKFTVRDYKSVSWGELTTDKLSGVIVAELPASWNQDPNQRARVAAGLVGMGPLGGAIGAPGPLVAPSKINLNAGQVEDILLKKETIARQAAAVAGAVPLAGGGFGGQLQGIGYTLALQREVSHRAVIDRLKLLQSLQTSLDAIEAQATDRDNRWVLRKLIVPEQVTLYYKDRKDSYDRGMTAAGGNEFTGGFGELKETVTFRVRGEDYETQPQTIVVVDRPRVERIESEREQPAYLYYRETGDVTASFLRTQRQPLEPVPEGTSGDETKLIVPDGTHVTLTLTISKELNPSLVSVAPTDPSHAKRYLNDSAPRVADRNKVRIYIPNIVEEHRFTLRFTDTDDVQGERKFVLEPRKDTAPRAVDFLPDEVIGKQAQEGYFVTAKARVPFKGRVFDDLGLARVRFACRVTPADSLGEQKIRSLVMAGAVPLAAPGFGGQIQSVAYVLALKRELDNLGSDEAGYEQFFEIPGFTRDMTNNRPAEGDRELLTAEEIRSRLKTPRKEPYRQLFKELVLTPDSWMDKFAEKKEMNRFVRNWIKPTDTRSVLDKDGKPWVPAPLSFDLPFWQLKYRHVIKDGNGKVVSDELRSIDAEQQPRLKREKGDADGDRIPPQRRFLVEVRLVAEDNYATGDVDAAGKPKPHTTSSVTHTFVVVPANELLARIAADEDRYYADLVKTVKPIRDAVNHAGNIRVTLSSQGVTATELNAFRARATDMIDALQAAHQEARQVYTAYRDILRRERLNQVGDVALDRIYGSIYKPLENAASVKNADDEGTMSEFEEAIKAVQDLKRILDNESRPVNERAKNGEKKAEEAGDALRGLQRNINNILAAMEGLSKLNELIKEIVRIENDQENLEILWRALYRDEFNKQTKPDD